MGDVPKDMMKKKREMTKSDVPGAKKALAADPNSLDAKEKVCGHTLTTTPEIACGPSPVAKADESVGDTPKVKEKSRSILKHNASADAEIEPTQTLLLKPVATAEVSENEIPKPKHTLKRVSTTEEVKCLPTQPTVATTEVTEQELQVKPVALMDKNVTPMSCKSRNVAPKAATKRDMELHYDLDNEKLAELKEAFHLFDLNNDGFIDKEDLKNTYITLGRTDICDEEIQCMLSEATNPLDFDAFVILLGYKSIELDPEEVLLKALSQWDYDNSGLISEERIKNDLMMWGDRFSSDEVEMALEDAPVFYRQDTRTSMIDYVKFCKILCGLRKKTKIP